MKMKDSESRQNLIGDSTEDIIDNVHSINFPDVLDRPLSSIEKTFLLHAERGDCATVKRIIDEYSNNPQEFDINCVDPLNRSALISAIENENIELIRILLEENIQVKDGLLHAIKEEYVEAVEVLLNWEEDNHKPGEPYSWERIDRASANFTTDITPLILAAHKNNYEIIKLLLDRGATLPMPHDVRFPSNPMVSHTLLANIVIEQRQHLSNCLHICLDHFNQHDIQYTTSDGHRLIKPDAVPQKDVSEFVDDSSSRCGCDECVFSSKADSLRHSQARINAYRALSSPSLISLSSNDPLLTAFELSWDLRRLSRMETEFRSEYIDMRNQVQSFATSLLDHARTSYELEIMLNYDPDGDTWVTGERQTLERLKLAIKYKQKAFIAHPNVQQLLASIWYEGLPGFRRKNMIGQGIQVAKLGMMFPIYCTIYMISPRSEMGLFMKKPFVKFICHSSSYAFFLMLLGAASQRIEILFLEWFGTDWVQDMVKEWKRKERGALFGIAECGVILYVISLIWSEIRSLWSDGLMEYISDLWNIVDFITNIFYVIWLSLRMTSVYVTWRDERTGKRTWYPREEWDSFEPMLLAEGAFAAGMIFSFLKLVHIFSVNPHLGPLQISLGRMIIDIVKFFFIYTLVLFAFGCGLNQLLWYYAELEKNKCYHLPSGLPDYDNNDKACGIWRRYANLFETSQSLFWASFGLVDLMSFELTGIKGFTRFWALLMFGSYSVINIIVLLNMLIAMMSNSYQIISERSDTEWKFARSRLWVNYFDDGDTLPPPFNIMPAPKNLLKALGCEKSGRSTRSFKEKSRERARERHACVMKLLVRRYVTAEQRKRDDYGITEDDVMEIRQDISSLRYELIDILRKNGMKAPEIKIQDVQGKKGKVMERRLLKDFHIGIVEGLVQEMAQSPNETKNVFGQIAKVISRRTTNKKKDWNAVVRRNTIPNDPIGSAQEAEQAQFKRQSLRRHILGNLQDTGKLDDQKLIEYNPRLSEIPRTARVAYAKFMTKKIQGDFKTSEEENPTEETNEEQTSDEKITTRKPSVTFQTSMDDAPTNSREGGAGGGPERGRNPQKPNALSSSEDRFTTDEDTHKKCLSPLKELSTPTESRAVTPDIDIDDQTTLELGVVSESTTKPSLSSPPLINVASEETVAFDDQDEVISEGNTKPTSDNLDSSTSSLTKDKDEEKKSSLSPSGNKDRETSTASPLSAKSKLTGKTRTGWI